MLKRLHIELDTDDGLEARFVAHYYASNDPQKMLRNCLMVGYLVASGEITIAEAAEAASAMESNDAEESRRKKKVGNALFGIKDA